MPLSSIDIRLKEKISFIIKWFLICATIGSDTESIPQGDTGSLLRADREAQPECNKKGILHKL